MLRKYLFKRRVCLNHCVLETCVERPHLFQKGLYTVCINWENQFEPYKVLNVCNRLPSEEFHDGLFSINLKLQLQFMLSDIVAAFLIRGLEAVLELSSHPPSMLLTKHVCVCTTTSLQHNKQHALLADIITWFTQVSLHLIGDLSLLKSKFGVTVTTCVQNCTAKRGY